MRIATADGKAALALSGGIDSAILAKFMPKGSPDFIIPPKTPMPRPVDEWLANWDGPQRDEFWTGCTENMTGDQKWYVYCLEKFLYMLDEVK